jgi:hypothetical protein
MLNSAPNKQDAAPLTFFALVFALSAPFLLLSAAHPMQLLPGLPLAALMVVCPLIAALVLAFSREGASAAVALIQRATSFRQSPAWIWFVIAILANPVLFGVALALQHLQGVEVPAVLISPHASVLFVVFLVAALSEEIGWSGYAFAPLQHRWGFLGASLMLGAVWAAWHLIPLLQIGRSPEWIAWWALWTVAARVIMMWLFNRSGGSVIAVALYHAVSNLSWQLYPIDGSYFDPHISGIIAAAIAIPLLLTHRSTRGGVHPPP